MSALQGDKRRLEHELATAKQEMRERLARMEKEQSLAKELVNKTSDTLQPYIQQFVNQVLILGKADTKLKITGCVNNLIYELNLICPSMLLGVLPQLEFKLKSTDGVYALNRF